MKNSSFSRAGYVSMSYILFVIFAKAIGLFVMLYSFINFKKLLRDKTRSNTYDKSINILIYIIILLITYTLFANIIGKLFIPASILGVIHFIIIIGLGITFISLGLRLRFLKDNLNMLKGQLIGIVIIVGSTYVFNGLVSNIYIITKYMWLKPMVRVSGFLFYILPILLFITLGNVFLKSNR